jgi:hypothetical protein
MSKRAVKDRVERKPASPIALSSSTRSELGTEVDAMTWMVGRRAWNLAIAGNGWYHFSDATHHATDTYLSHLYSKRTRAHGNRD